MAEFRILGMRHHHQHTVALQSMDQSMFCFSIVYRHYSWHYTETIPAIQATPHQLQEQGKPLWNGQKVVKGVIQEIGYDETYQDIQLQSTPVCQYGDQYNLIHHRTVQCSSWFSSAYQKHMSRHMMTILTNHPTLRLLKQTRVIVTSFLIVSNKYLLSLKLLELKASYNLR